MSHDAEPESETHRSKPSLSEQSLSSSSDAVHQQSGHSERPLLSAPSTTESPENRQLPTSRADTAGRKRAGPKKSSTFNLSAGTNVLAASTIPAASSSAVSSQQTVSRSGSSTNVATVAATAALTTERCPWCHQVLERYDEQTLGLGMICLATFVHREPSLAAPYLRDMLLTAARLANASLYSWQSNL